MKRDSGDVGNKRKWPFLLRLFVPICLVAVYILSQTYFESKRQIAMQNAVKDLCFGMTSLEVRQVLQSHGVKVFPLESEKSIDTAFRDSTFSLYDYFNSDKQITYFRIAPKSGLWLVFTQKYRYFIDDDFPRVNYDLPECREEN